MAEWGTGATSEESGGKGQAPLSSSSSSNGSDTASSVQPSPSEVEQLELFYGLDDTPSPRSSSDVDTPAEEDDDEEEEDDDDDEEDDTPDGNEAAPASPYEVLNPHGTPSEEEAAGGEESEVAPAAKDAAVDDKDEDGYDGDVEKPKAPKRPRQDGDHAEASASKKKKKDA